MDDDKSYCGFENGQDWVDDLAIEDYMLNRRVEIPQNEKGSFMRKSIIYIILGIVIGAGVYDLAINLKISYNQDTLKVYCKKGAMFEQVHQGTDVYVKTKLECINETEEGKQNDNSRRSNSTQN